MIKTQLLKLFRLSFDTNRIFGLDILRAVAILCVMLEHGRSLYPESIRPITHILSFDGVSIFFVLSGFLIGSILIKQLEKYEFTFAFLGRFWVRRWARTLPAYILALIVLMIISHFTVEGFRFWDFRSYFIFSQNLCSHNYFFFPEAWSLSVEEWFYLILPVLLFISIRLLRLSVAKSILLVAISILLAITYFRFNRYMGMENVANFATWDLSFRKQVFMRLDAIMFGVIGAYFAFYRNIIWLKHRKALFFIGLIILTVQQCVTYYEWYSLDIYYSVFSFTLNSIGTLFLLPYLSTIRSGKGRIYRLITRMSLISYSMYLLNLSFVKWLIVDPLGINNVSTSNFLGDLLNSSLFWGITVGLSVLFYKYFEIPMMKLRDRKWITERLKLRQKKI